MAAFTASTEATEVQRKEGEILAIPMMNNVKIFKGDLVLADATTGTARPVYGTGTTGDKFMGVAMESVDNTLTGHEEAGKSVRVYRTSSFLFTKASAAIADIGTAMYTDVSAAGTPTTVIAAASKASFVGMVTEYIDATHVRVQINTGDILNLGAA